MLRSDFHRFEPGFQSFEGVPVTREQDLELVAAVEPTVERLIAEHRERREHWYAHEYVP